MVLFYAVCCALRLARFNTQLVAEPPPWRSNFFSGVAAPAGAGLIMVPMFASFEWGHWLARSPILNAVPLQLYAYHVALAKGYNIDKPRNLAKSVTVM